MMAQNRSLHERLLTFAPPHHFPAYIATTVERDEKGAYLKIPLISPLAAAYKHQACKYCSSFEVGSSDLPCCFPFFHVGLYSHKFLNQSHFPPTVSAQENVQRGARFLARGQQEMTQPKTFMCLPEAIVIISFVCLPRVVVKAPLALPVFQTE